MDLEFTRKPKKKMVGIRVTDKEYKTIKEIAKLNRASIAETCGVLIRTMLKKLK